MPSLVHLPANASAAVHAGCSLVEQFLSARPLKTISICSHFFFLQVTTSSISSLARLPWGSKVATSSGENIYSAIGAPTLQLYEFGKNIKFCWIWLIAHLFLAFIMRYSTVLIKSFVVLPTEACPFCRRVREALTELDLSAEVLNSTMSYSDSSFITLVWYLGHAGDIIVFVTLEWCLLVNYNLASWMFQVYPCPKGSLRHREVVKKIGGKEQYVFAC